jgi:hypothetical protein
MIVICAKIILYLTEVLKLQQPQTLALLDLLTVGLELPLFVQLAKQDIISAVDLVLKVPPLSLERSFHSS